MIRVHRLQRLIVDKNQDEVLLSQLKWPVETIFCGVRPKTNYDTTNTLMPTSWHKHSVQTLTTVETGEMDANAWYLGVMLANDPPQAADWTASLARVDHKPTNVNFATALGVPATTVLSVNQINTVLQRNGYKPLVGTFANPAAPTIAEITAALPNGAKVAKFYQSQPCFDTLGVKAHGIELFKSVISSTFYNSYLPFHYGEGHIRTPADNGKFMIPFGLYPGSYQPNGHINISRAREFYINYTSSVISNLNPGELYIIAVAINFLLISDGSAILRYAT